MVTAPDTLGVYVNNLFVVVFKYISPIAAIVFGPCGLEIIWVPRSPVSPIGPVSPVAPVSPIAPITPPPP